jgi:quercetin dioxygenase-like cupin family protein
MLKQILICTTMITLAANGSASAHEQPLVVSQSASPPASAQTAGIKRTPLQKVEVPGTNYELVFGLAEFSANATIDSHTHPGDVLAYVIDGEFPLAVEGQPHRVFKAGESFLVPAERVHVERMGDKGAKVIALYVVPKGKPLATLAK